MTNYSFEDALLDMEDLEQYQDFIYDIIDIASLKGRDSKAVQKNQVAKNEDTDFRKGVCESPQDAFTWNTKEKNEFIAKMKLKEQKVSSEMICGKPIEPYKEINVIKTGRELNEKSANRRIVQKIIQFPTHFYNVILEM